MSTDDVMEGNKIAETELQEFFMAEKQKAQIQAQVKWYNLKLKVFVFIIYELF